MINAVVFIGPESTLKSTLVKQTASYFAVPYLPEVARNYAKAVLKHKNRYLISSDILKLARLEQHQYNRLKQTIKKELFIVQDTDNISTLVYASYYYKSFNTQLLKPYIDTKHKIYILSYPDVNLVEDDIRDLSANRLALFHRFKKELDLRQLPYKVIMGSLENRFTQAIGFIKLNNL
tara:strand:- start:1606 stop:2139 length:534 start_codon:yes stop_codon:yes gene_type:complete